MEPPLTKQSNRNGMSPMRDLKHQDRASSSDPNPNTTAVLVHDRAQIRSRVGIRGLGSISCASIACWVILVATARPTREIKEKRMSLFYIPFFVFYFSPSKRGAGNKGPFASGRSEPVLGWRAAAYVTRSAASGWGPKNLAHPLLREIVPFVASFFFGGSLCLFLRTRHQQVRRKKPRIP